MATDHPLTEEDLGVYELHMSRVKARIDNAAAFLQEPHTYPRIESALLQLRQALEAVMMSTLITNRAAIDEVSVAMKKRKASDVQKLVRGINPDYWPQATKDVPATDGKPGKIVAVESGYLDASAYSRTWGELSEWLHARNPFASMPSLADGVRLGARVHRELVTLLNHHSVHLFDRHHWLVCIMNSEQSGQVKAYSFSRVDT